MRLCMHYQQKNYGAAAMVPLSQLSNYYYQLVFLYVLDWGECACVCLGVWDLDYCYHLRPLIPPACCQMEDK